MKLITPFISIVTDLSDSVFYLTNTYCF